MSLTDTDKSGTGRGNPKLNTNDTLASKAARNTTRVVTLTSDFTGVTKSSIGLGNVDNTSDANKPVSTAQQTALNAKQNTRTVIRSSGSFNVASAPNTDYFYILTGTHVPTMPACAGNTNRYVFKNATGAGIAFVFDGVETADGASLTLAAGAAVDLISDQVSDWKKV